MQLGQLGLFQEGRSISSVTWQRKGHHQQAKLVILINPHLSLVNILTSMLIPSPKKPKDVVEGDKDDGETIESIETNKWTWVEC